MHPDLGRPEFAAFYASKPMLDVGQALMRCERNELMMALFQLLVRPPA